MVNVDNLIEEKMVRKILRFVNDEVDIDHIPQPMIIVGAQGSGKTTLVKSLATVLKKNDWYGDIDFFSGKRFFCSNDIISAIEKSSPDENLNPERNEIPRRHIVIIDDIDFFFDRSTFDDQFILRSFLYQDSAPLIIATASVINEALTDYKAPFFEGIRILLIPPFKLSMLNPSDIVPEILDRLSNIMTYLPPVIGSFKTAMDIVRISDSPKNDMKELLSQVSARYRAKFENMSDRAQRIIYSMATVSNPVKLSELRSLTGLQSGILSTYLRQMTNSGDIRKINPGQKGTPYEIKDKLFKLWLSEV